jgi:general secretion pathway protein F
MRFRLKVVKGGAGVSALELEAADAALAAAEARRRGYTVLSAHGARRFGLPAAGAGGFPLVLFAHELHALLQAGLPLLEALDSLAEKSPERASEVLHELVRRLREGQSFSDALAERPDAFPAFFVATVRASERTGALAAALERFAAYRTQLDAVRKKVVAASIYPALLVGSGMLVLCFLLVYVVPRFARIFEESGVALPASSQALVAWGALVQAHGGLMALAAGAALGAAAWALSLPAARARLLEALWRIGPLGERLRVFELGRFYRTLGMLVRGGLPMVPALDLAAHVLPQALRGRLGAAREAISGGAAPSAALQEAGLATPIALRMLAVGERGGNLGEMLERVAAFLDEETGRWIEWFTRLFEPLLMALIGLLIGAIVIAMYVPIFELAGAVQ